MRRVLALRSIGRWRDFVPAINACAVPRWGALWESRKHFAQEMCDGRANAAEPLLWNLAKEAERSSTLEDLLGSLRASDARCAQFSLDFARFESRFASKFETNEVNATDVIGKLFAKLVGRLETVSSLSIVVSSPTVLEAVLMMLSFAGSTLVAPPLSVAHLEIVVYDRAFAASTRRDEDENSSTETQESLATLLTLLGQRCRKVETLALSQVNLESFTRSFEWDRHAVHSLAGLLSASAEKLERVDLSHVPLAAEVADDGSGWSSPSAYAALSAALGRCASLQHLNLRGQHAFLVRSPFLRKDLASLAHLKTLNVSSSHMNDVAIMHMLTSLRAGIGGWDRLETLGMDQGGLTAYSVSLMSKDLDRYAADEGNSESGDDRPKIRSLSLASNALAGTAEDAFSLSSVLTRCEDLADVNLRHNAITSKHAGVVISGLSRAVHMRKIQLHSNRLGDHGLIESLPYTKNWVELQELDLTRCRLTSLGLMHLARAMHMWEKLTTLRLSRNDFRRMGSDAFARLEQALKKGSSSSSTENLSLFVYDPTFMQGDTENRYRGGEKVPTSFELDRRDAETGRRRYKGTEEFADEADADMRDSRALGDLAPFVAFGESLAVSRCLRVLDLSDCALSDAAAFAGIMSGVRALPLTGLCLAANPLFGLEANVHSLANALRPLCSHSLRSLDLSGTQLGDLGITILSEGAEYQEDGYDADMSSPTQMESSGVCMHMAAVEELRLSSCGIGKDGFASLSLAVPFMTSLRQLFLDGNAIHSAEDVSLLLEALSTLPSLEFVGLSSHNGRTVQLQKCNGYDSLRAKGVYVHH